LLNISAAILLYKEKEKTATIILEIINIIMDNKKDPLLSKLSTMQLYALFKNATGKEKVECNFRELFAVRLNCFAVGEKA